MSGWLEHKPLKRLQVLFFIHPHHCGDFTFKYDRKILSTVSSFLSYFSLSTFLHEQNFRAHSSSDQNNTDHKLLRFTVSYTELNNWKLIFPQIIAYMMWLKSTTFDKRAPACFCDNDCQNRNKVIKTNEVSIHQAKAFYQAVTLKVIRYGSHHIHSHSRHSWHQEGVSLSGCRAVIYHTEIEGMLCYQASWERRHEGASLWLMFCWSI